MPTANPYATATPATPPTLGYGQQGKAPIDAVNQWMRSQPWYQSLIRSFGQDPSNVHLNDAQKQAIVRAAQANGVVVDEGHNGQQVDDSGNFEPKSSSTLSKVLIVGGIAAAALATAGIAGVFSGIGAGVGEGAATGIGALDATSLGLPVTAGLGTAGAAGVTAGAAGAGTAAFDAAGNFIGPSTVSSVAPPSAVAPKVSSWLAPGIGVAGNIIGTAIAANAQSSAADKQAAGVQAALDFEKQQYADLTGRLAPYVAAGTSSTDRMTQLLGLPARPATTATAPPTRGPAVGNAPPVSPAAAGVSITSQPLPRSGDAGQLVTLQAPDGTVKQFPADQAQRILQVKDANGQSAKIVQAA